MLAKARFFLHLGLGLFFLYFALTQNVLCQVVDELTETGRQIAKNANITPEMVPHSGEGRQEDFKAQYVLGWMYFGSAR